MEIREYKFRNIGTYEIVEQGFLRGARLEMTRAVRPREELTFFFEHKENAPIYNYTIRLYKDGDVVQGTYLTSFYRRSGKYLHVYYEKEKCQNTSKT